jgi:hypothetical protein
MIITFVSAKKCYLLLALSVVFSAGSFKGIDEGYYKTFQALLANQNGHPAPVCYHFSAGRELCYAFKPTDNNSLSHYDEQ